MKGTILTFLTLFSSLNGWELPSPAFIESVMEHFTRNGIIIYVPKISLNDVAKHKKEATLG